MGDRDRPNAGGQHAGKGGGAEALARYKMYEYRANSSLVLTADSRSSRGQNEGTGEPETLWGRINPKGFGDRAGAGKKEDLEEMKTKAKSKREGKERKPTDSMEEVSRKRKKARGNGTHDDVLTLGSEGMYRPKTRETRAAYESLLNAIQAQFGDQPADIIRGAAEEVLAALKVDAKKDDVKKKEIEELMGTMTNERFAQLVATGKLITDYADSGDVVDMEALDEDMGVAMKFENEDEDEADSDADEVKDGSDSDDDGLGEAGRGGMHTMDVDADGDEDDGGINVQDIDAYWLQREVAKAFGDAVKKDERLSQKLAEEVLSTLESGEEADIENNLVLLLDMDKFALVKLLLKNRLKIVWCTRLARAQNEEEVARLEAEMEANADTVKILKELHATRASARERQNAMERRIREEARGLKREGATEEGAAAATGAAAAGRRVLELDALAFQQGGHLMSNKRCELPAGSYRTQKKGYEEVHVPALKPKPFGDNEKLVQIADMPKWAQPAFKGMEKLNRIQSRVYDTAFFSPDNMLVCAPTGAGKTNVAMLTILHEIGLHVRDDGSVDTSAFKIVFVAPMKALVAEMVGNLSQRLEPFGVSVKELTGDISMSRSQIEATQVIVTTPEKWDIITRKSGDRTYTQQVKLLIIDEVHLLHDGRGPVIENIVARTVRQIEATQEMVRLVGLSATLPNYDDVAAFMRVDAAKGLFVFDNSFRPCPLAQQYIGISVKKALQRFQLMNEICYEKVLDSAGKHQVIIFVHSRKETAKTAKAVRDQAMSQDTLGRFMKEDAASREVLQTEAEAVKNADLKDLLPYGFGIHHAGMSRADRTLVEDLFADGHIQVLVSTATLAWGVNLPAHTVIIKGTQVYNPEKAAWGELSPLDVMQMMGRAGRPQYDTYGEGIILTGNTELQFYLSVFNQQLPIESQFVTNLPDSLNAEIVLGTVNNVKDAATWLGYTYLYVRMLRNPALYGVPVEALDNDQDLSSRRADLIHTAAAMLDKHGLVKYDRRSGALQATDLGRIASHYYVSHGTVAIYNEHLKPTMGEIELCRLFSLSEEFKFLVVRQEEKVELAKLLERVPIPVKESLDEPSAKVNVLLQAYISNLKLEGLALTSDMVYVTQSSGRLMRALYEIVLKRGWASLADKALALCKMVSKRMWGSQTPLRQFKGIPAELLLKMERKDLPWERYYDLSSQEIGELIRFPKMGKAIHRFVHQFPRLELAATVQPITRSVLKVDLTITPDFQWDDKLHGGVEPFWILVEDNDGEAILHHEFFILKRAFAEEDHTVSFTVPVLDPLPPQYFIRCVSDRWLGSETLLPVSFRHLILPEKYPPPTELLDLQPLPVSALRNGRYEALYNGISHFNPIQTQVFTSLYSSDDNVLVCAPTGSGKTTCAEFALLRLYSKHAEGSLVGVRAVYMGPNEALVTQRYKDWAARFGTLGVNVVMLTGESAADLKLLDKGNLICTTPERWDMLSRRWKQRKNVQSVALFVADELHLLGGERGHVMEVVTSRMRYISSQLETKCRVVGLATALANARDLGEWIGVGAHGLFNFPPGVRPVPLEIQINGVDIINFEARMQAMAKPAYASLVQHVNDGDAAVVFVPTRKHARLTALDLLTFAAADGLPKRFLQCAEADLEPFMERLREPALKHAVAFGVAFLHEGMLPSEREAVEALFAAGAVQVVVCTASMAWGVTLRCRCVVIMGTQYYDGSNTGGADYPVTDLLQMMGCATAEGSDEAAGAASGVCVLMCHAPRKEYYKKFLFEPFPVESHLDHFLTDHLSAEVVTRTIENKQDAVDYLTWSFYYRRLAQNPNYYNLTGVSHRHLSDHLSDLVETTVADLEEAKALTVEDDMDLSPLNLGMIAAYYYISYSTIELFSSSLTAKTKMKGLVEILCSAAEFDALPMRPGDEEAVKKILMHTPLTLDTPKYSDPHTKANALLQGHFSRTALQGDLVLDQRAVLLDAHRLLQAMVDVVSSSGWLAPALACMELAQMTTQALWDKDPPLMQLPHVTREVAQRCAAAEVEDVIGLIEMEDADRAKLLGMPEAKLEAVAKWCNRYPDIDLKFDIEDKDDIATGDAVTVLVQLERDFDGELPPVDAARFPKAKEENWWLVVGEPKTNKLIAIKRVALGKRSKVKLEFAAPEETGSYTYLLYFMCDSYLGCDQEYELSFDVKEGEDDSGGEEEDTENDAMKE